MNMENMGNIFLGLAVACLLFHGLTLALVAWRSRWQPQSQVKNWQEEFVTILRPVSGLENNLERTLTSAFMLEHKRIEIIFCVGRDDDPVVPLVKKIMACYPQIPSKLLIGDDPISQNPKLNNLVKGWKQARFDWIVMTDSNVLMPPDYIARLFARWQEHTGLVTSPPLGVEANNFAAEIEAAFLNSYQARWQLCSDSIGNGFAQGKTLFWHRDVLEQAGGIEALREEMAEDAAATKLVRRQGLKVRLSAMPFFQPLGDKTFQATWQRQLRWAKLRRDSFPLFFYLEILSGLVFPLICLGAAYVMGSIPGWGIPVYIILWYAAELLVNIYVGWPWRARHLLAIITRDSLLPALWCAAFGPGGYQWQGYQVDMSNKSQQNNSPT